MVVARRGRRSAIERRLLVVVACVLAGTALTLATLARDTVGWYASMTLELVASALLLSLLLGELRRLGELGRVADARAGAVDPLTGVKTRASTLVAAERLNAARAAGAPLGLALLDVDGLRAIGDRARPAGRRRRDGWRSRRGCASCCATPTCSAARATRAS